jgi:hypothetical protein
MDGCNANRRVGFGFLDGLQVDKGGDSGSVERGAFGTRTVIVACARCLFNTESYSEHYYNKENLRVGTKAGLNRRRVQHGEKISLGKMARSNEKKIA